MSFILRRPNSDAAPLISITSFNYSSEPMTRHKTRRLAVSGLLVAVGLLS